jgi:hypothetical protein
MCGERPVTLFLQPPPSDALRLVPLMRLLINQIARALMVAALVAYSRVHTGVHYPGDVLAGALIGTALAQVTTHAGGRLGTRIHRRIVPSR